LAFFTDDWFETRSSERSSRGRLRLAPIALTLRARAAGVSSFDGLRMRGRGRLPCALDPVSSSFETLASQALRMRTPGPQGGVSNPHGESL
jgi:hypothetical protein